MKAPDKSNDPEIERHHEDRPDSNPLADLGGSVQESTQGAGEEAEFFELPFLKILQDSPGMKGYTYRFNASGDGTEEALLAGDDIGW